MKNIQKSSCDLVIVSLIGIGIGIGIALVRYINQAFAGLLALSLQSTQMIYALDLATRPY